MADRGDVRINQKIELGQLLLQLALTGMRQLEQSRQPSVLAAIDLIGDECDQILAGAHQLGEVGFALIGRKRGRRVQSDAVVAQDGRVDGIGLGQPATGPCKVAQLPGD